MGSVVTQPGQGLGGLTERVVEAIAWAANLFPSLRDPVDRQSQRIQDYALDAVYSLFPDEPNASAWNKHGEELANYCMQAQNALLALERKGADLKGEAPQEYALGIIGIYGSLGRLQQALLAHTRQSVLTLTPEQALEQALDLQRCNLRPQEYIIRYGVHVQMMLEDLVKARPGLNTIAPPLEAAVNTSFTQTWGAARDRLHEVCVGQFAQIEDALFSSTTKGFAAYMHAELDGAAAKLIYAKPRGQVPSSKELLAELRSHEARLDEVSVAPNLNREIQARIDACFPKDQDSSAKAQWGQVYLQAFLYERFEKLSR
jgi:hypothetical protein